MPRYTKSKNKKLVRKTKRFKHPYQIIHFLQTANDKQMQPFRDTARDYLTGVTVPPVKLQRRALQKIALLDPKELTKHAVHDFNGDNALGGGVGSGIAVIWNQIMHLLGVDKLSDAISGVNKPKKQQSLDAQFAAYLVDLTYKAEKDRPSDALGRFERMPKYDTEHVSVWKNTLTGEMTVAVRGTKMNASDLLSDIKLLFGETQTDSKELDEILDQLEYDFPKQKYNIAGHSLGTAIIATQQPEHGDHWNNAYMYNAASSPGQNDQYETNLANDDTYEWFLNHSDLVSNNLLHFMNEGTLQDRVQFGDYVYSPVSAHSLTQWYPPGFANPQKPQETWLTPYEYKEPTETPKPQETWLTPYEFKGKTPETQAAN
jgi:hypothetical protein